MMAWLAACERGIHEFGGRSTSGTARGSDKQIATETRYFHSDMITSSTVDTTHKRCSTNYSRDHDTIARITKSRFFSEEAQLQASPSVGLAATVAARLLLLPGAV